MRIRVRIWRFPLRRRAHVVPLASQAVETLRALRKLTGHQSFVLWSPRTESKRISEGTMNKALRKLGYDTKAEDCGHGFRKTASTLLNAQGFDERHIEMQLAHAVGGIAGIYNHAKYPPERCKMMRSWADLLDGLRASGDNVIAIESAAA